MKEVCLVMRIPNKWVDAKYYIPRKLTSNQLWGHLRAWRFYLRRDFHTLIKKCFALLFNWCEISQFTPFKAQHLGGHLLPSPIDVAQRLLTRCLMNEFKVRTVSVSLATKCKRSNRCPLKLVEYNIYWRSVLVSLWNSFIFGLNLFHCLGLA